MNERTSRFPFTFNIDAGGRAFLVTVQEFFYSGDNLDYTVDVRDIITGMESQAIEEAHDPELLISAGQFRDCVRSVFMNATTKWQDGRMVNPGGQPLPEDFEIRIIT